MTNVAIRTERMPQGSNRAEARRRYCAPSLVKGPMLATITAGDSVVSGAGAG
jgi:hypothetical protein